METRRVEASLTSIIISITLGMTGFLGILNLFFVYIFRKKRLVEVFFYYGTALIELAIFVVALLLRLHVITSVPYPLPPGLNFNRAEIGTALAIGIGLFPAAYWHRTSIAQLRRRIEEDGKLMKQRTGVSVRSNVPGEWMN